MTRIDWRLPENRVEAFMRNYEFTLEYLAHPGMVYSWLPALAEGLDEAGRAWVVWLNGNTENPVTTLLLLEASDGDPKNWRKAVQFWDKNFSSLQWDTDRRHQKSKFGEATTRLVSCGHEWGPPPETWASAWRWATDQPYMGRMSSWSMLEYARILFPGSPDAEDLMLSSKGSRSHRNGLAILLGYDAAYWQEDAAKILGIRQELEEWSHQLYSRSLERIEHKDVCRLTFESALCTYKSWHKPNRRYPGVYADMAYLRLLRGEKHFGKRFTVLWDARQRDLPEWLRLEDCPNDPGLSPRKQNRYLESGEIPMLHHHFIDMEEVLL